MSTGPETVTITAAELDALLAIERAATVLAAGDLADPDEAANVRDDLPHLLDNLALTRPVTSPVTALADRLPRRFADGGVLPGLGQFRGPLAAGLDEARAQDRWVADMAARGALSPEHRAAYSALVDAGVQPFQLRFLANAITCGVAAPATEKESDR
ncbi:hypothetical protein ACIOWF_06850 [Cellulosimicrobium cellulans]|uniref:hypothetical protein n=1 Tax=Cellulosimicrobium cellulans TaxID=1710 RepID=UPI00382567A7